MKYFFFFCKSKEFTDLNGQNNKLNENFYTKTLVIMLAFSNLINLNKENTALFMEIKIKKIEERNYIVQKNNIIALRWATMERQSLWGAFFFFVINF